jgi:hypothetical protein
MKKLSSSSILEEITPILEGRVKPEKPLSYFGRAIRGGRGNIGNCRTIVEEMEKYSTVLSKHTILSSIYDHDDVTDFERKWKERFPEINVFQRDMKMIGMSKRFVADTTVESTGGGYEIFEAYYRAIPSALFCHEKARYRPTMYLYTDRLTTPTIEELFYLHDVKIPIYYYSNKNIKEVAEREIRNLFLGSDKT